MNYPGAEEIPDGHNPQFEDIDPPEIAHDIGISRDEAINGCKINLNFLAAVCLPEVYKFAFPPLFLALWQLLTEAAHMVRGHRKLALGLPRGFAKTLVLKLFVIYCVLFTDRRFILVVCNTASLAENFVADVLDTLESSNILRLFGDFRLGRTKDTQELQKFTFRGRHITIAALGCNSSLRGLNLKYVRPDVILMDDMQNKEESASPTVSEAQLTWMMGTLMKACDKTRCIFVYLGNMYPTAGCILKKLKTNPSWISFITGAILEDGQSLWPELRSVDSLLEELEDDESMGHPEIFYSEVMNDDEAGARSTLDFSLMNVWESMDETLPLLHSGGFVIIDPALKKAKSDNTAIGAVLIFDGEPILWEIEEGRFDEYNKIIVALKLAIKYHLTAIVVEDAAYQSSLCFWINQVKVKLNLNAIQELTVSTGSIAKSSRILDAAKQLTAKKPGTRLWIHPQVRSLVVHEFMYWDPLKTKNKDNVLDLLAHAWKVINLYGPQLLIAFEQAQNAVAAAFSDDIAPAF